ncbi:LPS-assembly protein LptD [Roseovarius sp. M141]|uniref:LPS-assembly protein LptD n=1 Tax=Roseovarius sp. M141 TaxID=2583806 RepID=UPI0020CD7DF8|nr:LPS assembly protein LptD [Roseovarius sp. M141]MCQ0092770.1 LPS-assembly protein LptD [Roseovarius sp. M141]
MIRLLRTLTLLLAILPGLAQAQGGAAPTRAALLIADEVLLEGSDTLVATGNVEAVYDGQRLKARRITYDKSAGKLTIDGPITLFDGNYTTVLADAGQLDRDLKNGILTGARIVMDDQLQLAATQINRKDGRYSQLYKAAVTSCQICAEGGTPLWQIRARRVIHDAETRQLYLDGAQFRIGTLPIAYFPRLRLPDPTVTRTTGFLTPSLYNSSLLGFGAKVPYFITIGDDKDLTLTPYYSTQTRTLEFRYRQAFADGGIEFEGAFSNDDLVSDDRAYLFGRGVFALPQEYVLRFNIEAVTDDTYLVDYNYSDEDRLDSEISVERIRRDEWRRAALTYFHTLRMGENSATLPTSVANFDYEKRYFPTRIGGELRIAAEAHGHYRWSTLDTDGPDYDLFADGRDVKRLTTTAEWLRTWTMFGGLRATAQTGLAVDLIHVNEAGTTSRSSITQATPNAALTLRYPLSKITGTGTTHVIEPMVQLAWIGGDTPNIANDESTRTEFDEGNLLSLSRFAAADRRERGASAAYGVSWSRFTPSGLRSTLTVGQIARDRAQREATGGLTFSRSSGLRGTTSDVLVAAQIATQNGLSITARGLFDGAFDTTKAEARASWRNAAVDLGATYIWLPPDLQENRPNTTSEWAIDGSYRLSRHWTGDAAWRYNAASNNSVRAGVGVTYTNECVEVSLSASRRFTSSTILEPSTDISLTVGLRGFSARAEDKSYVRECKK